MQQKTLITGGAGFIGSHLAERLRSRGEEVVIIDDLSTGNETNIAHLLGNDCSLIKGRVSEVLTAQPELLDGVRHIYHLAASVGVQLVKDNPAATIQNNVHETGAVLEAAHHVNAVVLIASSSEVYGKSADIPLREDGDLIYGPPTGPRWSYALSKAFDEHLALSYHKQAQGSGGKSSGGAVVARLFNTIGPRQVGHYGMVVPRFVAAALSGKPLEVYGDGQQTRAFCDVRDVVGALVGLMENEHCHGEVFNVGSEEEVTIDELADRVIALSGSSSQKQHIAFDDAYEPGFEDPFRRRVPDTSKLRETIGFEREFGLNETLKELIA